MNTFYIISGGTFVHVAPHFSLAAPAYGKVGRELAPLLAEAFVRSGQPDTCVRLLFTRMALGATERSAEERGTLSQAGLDDLVTNEDVAQLVDRLVSLPETRGMVMACALCDWEPSAISPAYIAGEAHFGKSEHPRLDSGREHILTLKATEKIVARVRSNRKDIFLVGFKTTAGAHPQEQYLKGLRLLKQASCNLVLANDIRTGHHQVITPEQARYHEGMDRKAALAGLAEMVALRARLTFTRATVVAGETVSWASPLIPDTLRQVVNHCIQRGAYKPFLGSTVGHFAVKAKDGTILTSRRKTDFNHLPEIGLVRIEARGDDCVIAYGFKPSVGGQSQRLIFTAHPELDCIVHFHCPLRPGSCVPIRSQRAYECGSHECGQNTRDGLKRFDDIMAVMLDRHGPNVVFSRNADPDKVIAFIEQNFDLEGRTDDEPAFNSLQASTGVAHALT
jgi:hypothetical protein